MDLNDLRVRYEDHYDALARANPPEEAARLAVGGDFDATGALEYYSLKAHGLVSENRVVDVGCGTGRLALQLARRGHRRYAGFDVVKSAVDRARAACGRPDWIFGTTDGLRIELPDAEADFVVFFSVFTHISPEHTFLYLKEARRLLRPQGLVIFTFLEFGIPCHWAQFASSVSRFGQPAVPTVFLDRGALRKFAEMLGFQVLGLVDGDKPTFPIEEEIVIADGSVLSGRGYLGQSLGILRKLPAAD